MTTALAGRAGSRANGRRNGTRPHFDVDAYRDEFPALAQRLNRQPLVYLDSAATSQRPSGVLDAMMGFYRQDNANAHSEVHELGKRAKRTQDEARKTVAKFLNAPSESEVVFVRGTTEGINIIARTWGEENVG